MFKYSEWFDNFADHNYQYTIRRCMGNSPIATRNSECRRTTNIFLNFKRVPLVQLRKIAWRLALREMEWFLSGSDHIDDLHPSVRQWWNPWADEHGRVRNNYSKQFRQFNGMQYDDKHCLYAGANTDQIQYLKDGIMNHPFSRRNVITTWNTTDMLCPKTPITNCHGTVIQTFVQLDGKLDLTMYQRSCDVVLGMPYNWIQYWAMLMYLAHRTGYKPGRFTWIGGDCHVYKAHYKIAKELLNTELPESTPDLIYSPSTARFKADDFTLDSEYKPAVDLKVPMII